MSRWALLGLALGAYGLGLVATAPATLIDAWLQQASTGTLRLAAATGTLWSGTGQLEIRDPSRRSGIGKTIGWSVRPAYLVAGKLTYDVVLDGTGRHFLATISPSRVEMTDAQINLPAAALNLAIPKLAPLGLTGDMLIQIGRFSYGSGIIEGNARLQWRSAGSTFTAVSPLGDYELRLDADGTTARAQLRTLQGPMQLDGEGSWAHGGKAVYRLTARVPPQYQQQLAPLLRMIAVDRGDGSFTLQ